MRIIIILKNIDLIRKKKNVKVMNRAFACSGIKFDAKDVIIKKPTLKTVQYEIHQCISAVVFIVAANALPHFSKIFPLTVVFVISVKALRQYIVIKQLITLLS